MRKILFYASIFLLGVAVVYMGVIGLPAATAVKKPNSKTIKPTSETPMKEYTQFFQRKMSDELGVYFLYTPPKSKYKLPLVVVLHGSTGFSYAASFLVTPEMQARYPSYILVPTTAHISWTEESKMGEVARLIAETVKKNPTIDYDRIYVIGCSMGGHGVYSALTYYPYMFAAGVAVCGGWKNPADAEQIKQVPIMILNGAQDPIVPPQFSRKMSKAIEAKGGEVHYVEFPNLSHNCDYIGFYPKAMWDWMFSKRKRPRAKTGR